MAQSEKDKDDHLGWGTGQFNLNWDWKKEYMAPLNGDYGLERFSQLSAAPDSTAIFGGPARFSGLGGSPASRLTPIGLVSNLSVASGVGVVRLFEIGSNRSFFTRGKAAPSLQFGRMLADQQNLISVLLKNSVANGSGIGLNAAGTAAAGPSGANSSVMMNLDSEYTNVPFGILLVLKTKGDPEGGSRGKVLSAIYLESCFMEGYGFSVDATAPVIQEGISIQFDRIVPVAIT